MTDTHPSASPRPQVSAEAIQKADERALLALVFGVLGLAVLPPFGIAGIVLGRRARRNLPPTHPKRSMALVGVVLGWVSVALIFVFLIPLVLFLFVL